MANYVFNGIDSGESNGTFVAGGLNPDFLYITYPRGFDTLNIRTDSQGNTILESALGGTFVLKNVTLDQLSDANFGQVDGDVDIGNNAPNTLSGSIVVGMGGNDTLSGQAAGSDDFLAGNQGDDDIDGLGGMDRIRGGQGSDDIEGFGAGSIVYGDKGSDDIQAGTFMNEEDDDTGVTIFGGSGDPNDPLDGGDDIVGSAYNDIIQGNGGADDIYGGGGEDEIRGGKDDDDVRGWSGDDWLRGDKGDDNIDGGWDADKLTGGEGKDDFLFELSGDDSDMFNLSRENIAEDALDLEAENFGAGNLHQLDWITDLDLGEDGFHGVDRIGLDGWDQFDDHVATVKNVAADNMADLFTAFDNAHFGGDDSNAIIIEVTSGGLSGKTFLLADVNGTDAPEYAMQITGYTGTLDESDIFNP